MNRRMAVRLLAGALGLVCVVALTQAIWSGARGTTCADFDSQQDAQAYYAGLDPYGSHPLDEDADGMACEELSRRPPTPAEVAAAWCDTPDMPAPTAFVGSVRSVAEQDEYHRQVTFDVTDWYTTDLGSEVTLSVPVSWSADNTDINGPWPIDLHDDWLIATSQWATPHVPSEMFLCVSEPLTTDARERWDERYGDT